MNPLPAAPDPKLQFVKKADRAEVIQPAEDLVTTAPHLLLREAIAAEVIIIILSLISLFFNAPLEEIANPGHTPNPAKAPWYFLGLQELLHYFPPVVAGVLIPTLVIIALVVIPYFGVNLRPRSIASLPSLRLRFWTTVIAAGICVLMFVFGCWPLISVTVLTWLAMQWGIIGQGSLGRAFGRLRIPDWIMIWFVASAGILTIIGIFFRGPGWSWIWPWMGGIY